MARQIECSCGETLLRKSALLCYQGKTVTCSECQRNTSPSELVYHCPRKCTKSHQTGFDLCLACARQSSQDVVDVTIDFGTHGLAKAFVLKDGLNKIETTRLLSQTSRSTQLASQPKENSECLASSSQNFGLTGSVSSEIVSKLHMLSHVIDQFLAEKQNPCKSMSKENSFAHTFEVFQRTSMYQECKEMFMNIMQSETTYRRIARQLFSMVKNNGIQFANASISKMYRRTNASVRLYDKTDRQLFDLISDELKRALPNDAFDAVEKDAWSICEKKSQSNHNTVLDTPLLVSEVFAIYAYAHHFSVSHLIHKTHAKEHNFDKLRVFQNVLFNALVKLHEYHKPDDTRFLSDKHHLYVYHGRQHEDGRSFNSFLSTSRDFNISKEFGSVVYRFDLLSPKNRDLIWADIGWISPFAESETLIAPLDAVEINALSFEVDGCDEIVEAFGTTMYFCDGKEEIQVFDPTPNGKERELSDGCIFYLRKNEHCQEWMRVWFEVNDRCLQIFGDANKTRLSHSYKFADDLEVKAVTNVNLVKSDAKFGFKIVMNREGEASRHDYFACKSPLTQMRCISAFKEKTRLTRFNDLIQRALKEKASLRFLQCDLEYFWNFKLMNSISRNREGEKKCDDFSGDHERPYMLIDCGGGTMDITCHKVNEDSCHLDSFPACGAVWGIDEEFVREWQSIQPADFRSEVLNNIDVSKGLYRAFQKHAFHRLPEGVEFFEKLELDQSTHQNEVNGYCNEQSHVGMKKQRLENISSDLTRRRNMCGTVAQV